MSTLVRDYASGLTENVGHAWNRFWYTPADALPLALLRILTGLAALYLVLSYSSDLTRFFGQEGLLPPATIEAWDVNFLDTDRALPLLHRLSYLSYTQSTAAIWLAHGLGIAALVLYTVGYATRMMSVLALVVVLSYIHRAPMLTAQAEPVLAMLIFYLCLGPCGKHLSLDAWLARRRSPARTAAPTWGANVALRLIQIHTAGLYLLIALNQLGGGGFGATWWTGEAMWWVVARPETRLVDFTWIAHYEDLIDFWTHSVIVFQLCFGSLIWNRWLRPILLAWSGVMWLLLALATGLVPYCLLMFIAGVAFVPGPSLRALTGRRASAA